MFDRSAILPALPVGNEEVAVPIILVATTILLVAGLGVSSWALRRQSRPIVRRAIAGLAILLVSVPGSIVLTLLLLPLWRWIEETLGIESIGHSGPADWCFEAVFVVCVIAFGSLYIFKFE